MQGRDLMLIIPTSYDAMLFPTKTRGVFCPARRLETPLWVKTCHVHSVKPRGPFRNLRSYFVKYAFRVAEGAERERLPLPVSASPFVCTVDASRVVNLLLLTKYGSLRGGPSQKIGIHNLGDGPPRVLLRPGWSEARLGQLGRLATARWQTMHWGR